MMQLSLIEERDHPELAELIGRVRESRGGRYSYPYTLLLHSPAIAAAWLEQVSAVRWKTKLDGQVREIVIIRVALLTRVSFSGKVHQDVYALKEGLTREQVAAIENWRESDLFTELQRAALAYADAMTLDIQVPDVVQDELQRHFSERQFVELTVLIGTYNMHSRIFQALEVERRATIDKCEPTSATRWSHAK